MAREKRKKRMLALSDHAIAIIETNATPRKRGEFVSRVLEEWEAGQTLEVRASGVLEGMDERLRRIEATLKRIETFASFKQA